MDILAVKPKLPHRWGLWLLVITAILVSCGAWAGELPAGFVEAWYSRRMFPLIAGMMAPLASAVPFSWMDIVLPGVVAFLVYAIWRREFLYVAAVPAAMYLFFFFCWGLNYQRLPLVSKLDYDPSRVTEEAVRRLREDGAARLNALFALREDAIPDNQAVVAEAARGVGDLVRMLDGVSFPRPSVKTSRLLNPFFRASGTSGMFNPFGYEALVAEPMLDVERPVIVMHEVAHLMGYANEGEANFIAFLASIRSEDPRARYSGWLYLWLYLRNQDADGLLDPGPRGDLEAIYEKIRRERVAWVSRASSRSFDAFLRANRVRGGVRSYSEIVRLAVGTRPSWERDVPSAPVP